MKFETHLGGVETFSQSEQQLFDEIERFLLARVLSSVDADPQAWISKNEAKLGEIFLEINADGKLEEAWERNPEAVADEISIKLEV